MDLHKITALPHSHLAKEKMSAARMGSYEKSGAQEGVQVQGEGPFAPSHCSAPASINEKKDEGGQQKYYETRAFLLSQAGKGESRMEPGYLCFKNMLSSGKPRSPSFQYMAFYMLLEKEICCSHD